LDLEQYDKQLVCELEAEEENVYQRYFPLMDNLGGDRNVEIMGKI